MKIALIGASGFVGSAILNEAVNRGHKVTAIVRHPERITNETVSKVKADAYNVNEIADAVKGHDIVVSAFNPGWADPDIYENYLRGIQTIQEAVKKSGVKRFLVVGGAGSLFIGPGQQLIDTPQFPSEWKPGALAVREYLEIIKNEDKLDWTFLSPAIEMHQGTSGTRKGKYRTGLDNPVFNEEGRSVISAEDMAIAIIDEAEQSKHIRKRFTVGY